MNTCRGTKLRRIIKFNPNNSPTALPRGFRFTSPLERSELPFSAVLGEVKYKISIFGPKAKMKPAEYLDGPASRIVGFKKFFISSALYLVHNFVTNDVKKNFDFYQQLNESFTGNHYMCLV